MCHRRITFIPLKVWSDLEVRDQGYFCPDSNFALNEIFYF